VDPPEDGSLVALGAVLADGSGLAAATIATPPVTSNAAAMPAVRTARLKPLDWSVVVGFVVGFVVGSAPGGAVAEPAGWSSHVMGYSFVFHRFGECGLVDQDIASSLRACAVRFTGTG
jgi:hypothetical protein